MGGLATGQGNKRAPLVERGNDLYETPPCAVQTLMRVERLPHAIWEPCCGPGAIVRELRGAGHEVLATDLVDYESPDQDHARRDFLMESDTRLCTGIVMNPPFKLASRFVAHAVKLVPYTAALLRLAFLEAGNLNGEAGRTRRYVLDEFPPCRVWVFKERLPMMHRAGWKGRKASSGMAFAWFVWSWDRRAGPTELRRMSWKKTCAA